MKVAHQDLPAQINFCLLKWLVQLDPILLVRPRAVLHAPLVSIAQQLQTVRLDARLEHTLM